MEDKYYCTRAEPGYYPPEVLNIAKRRVADLLHKSRLDTTPLSVLLESAYLIGVTDGGSAIIDRLPPPPEKEE